MKHTTHTTGHSEAVTKRVLPATAMMSATVGTDRRAVPLRGRSAAEAAGFSSETNLHRAIRVQENIGDVLAKRPYRSHSVPPSLHFASE